MAPFSESSPMMRRTPMRGGWRSSWRARTPSVTSRRHRLRVVRAGCSSIIAQRPRHDGGRRLLTPRAGGISDRSAGELETGGARYSSGRLHEVPPVPTCKRFHPLMARSIPVADRRRAGRLGRGAQSGRHLPGAGRARPHACKCHGTSARGCLYRRGIDHRHSRTDGADRHRDNLVARRAGLYARACPRRILALAPRRQAQRHRGQQRAPGFRLCLAQQVD
jgi:hypothetical protein